MRARLKHWWYEVTEFVKNCLVYNRKNFMRCYRLSTAGWENDIEKIPLMIEGCSDKNPFVREAASGALHRLVERNEQQLETFLPLLLPAREVLIKLIWDHPSEGAARHAVIALGCFDDGSSDEIRRVMWFAMTTRDSMGAVEARKFLVGRDLIRL